MSESKVEIKVGLFVFLCIIILAVLLILFSKGLSLSAKTYNIILNTPNVGGLRVQSQVLMSGVKIGTVSRAVLVPEGTNVQVYLSILKEQRIPTNAIFRIEQAGFLGDQFVSISPGTNNLQTAVFADGDQVHAEAPFDLQEVAAKAGSLIDRMDGALKKLDGAIEDVRNHALNEATLGHFANSISNLDSVTASARGAVERINNLIATNEAPASLAVSNFVLFSAKLSDVGDQAKAILARNDAEFSATVSNLHTSSAQLSGLLADVRSGKGLAGQLIEDKAVAHDFSILSSNLAVTSSELNRLGFWHWMFRKSRPETNSPVNTAAPKADR